MNNTIILIILYLFSFLCGCSNNGIEGSVERYGDKKRLASVVVEARTQTNIKEHMSKSYKTGKTNSAGQFKISGLLPQKNYELQVKDSNSNFISESMYIHVPEKGTRLLEKPLIACPFPPDGGAWVYQFSSDKFTRLNLENNNIVKLRVHAGLIGGAFGNTSAFSIADEDTSKICDEIERDGLLVVWGIYGTIKAIGQLHKIERKHVSLGQNGSRTIEEGWYYNIADFYGEDFMIVGYKLLKPYVQGPNLKDALNIKTHVIWALPLTYFLPGLHILITEVASGQRAGSILGGESHPREGFLIRIK